MRIEESSVLQMSIDILFILSVGQMFSRDVCGNVSAVIFYRDFERLRVGPHYLQRRFSPYYNRLEVLSQLL